MGAGKRQTRTLITWHLRDGILWQDGEPFTSADIKFTIEYLKKLQGAEFRQECAGHREGRDP